MRRYILKKSAFLLFSLFVVISITFFLMQLVPGDPFTEDKAIPEEIMKALYHHYGLDDPWYMQYVRYLKGVVTWNFGPSFKHEARLVTEIIENGFPVSFLLGGEALLIALFLGIPLGATAALKRMRGGDRLVVTLAILGISVPSFILATFLQYILAMKLDLLPVARWGSFAQTILPALSLAALPTAYIAKLTRANMIEVLQQDYIQTARSKGLNSFQILWFHALRNALLPVVTYLGSLSTAIMTGSFVVEKIFGIPGLGYWFVMSVLNRDYTVIMGTTVFYSALLLVTIFLVDLIYLLIDPRMRRGAS